MKIIKAMDKMGVGGSEVERCVQKHPWTLDYVYLFVLFCFVYCKNLTLGPPRDTR